MLKIQSKRWAHWTSLLSVYPPKILQPLEKNCRPSTYVSNGSTWWSPNPAFKRDHHYWHIIMVLAAIPLWNAINSIRTELQAMEFIFIIHSPLLSSALKSNAFCCRLLRWVLRWTTQHNKSHSIWSSEGQNLPKEHANLTWESRNRIHFSWNVCFTCSSISRGSN